MENKIKKYLSKCDKDTLIELYLQMRFERDLYAELYENNNALSLAIEIVKRGGVDD